jgi:hypothetical protein
MRIIIMILVCFIPLSIYKHLSKTERRFSFLPIINLVTTEKIINIDVKSRTTTLSTNRQKQ